MAERWAKFRWGETSLFGRIVWVVIAGLVLLHVGGVYFYGHERMVESARTFAIGAAERGYALDALLATQPELLPLLQYPGFELARVARIPDGDRRDWPHNDEVITDVRARLVELGLPRAEELDLWYAIRRGPPRLQLYLPSRAGGWLEITARTHVTRGRFSMGGVTMTLLLIAIVLVILFVMRRSSRQLSRFVAAAETLGASTAPPEPLPESVGPRELRRASVAFNVMQDRVTRLLKERAAMLAGMSHDLRTLAARIGLRLESLADEEQRRKAAHDLDLMTDILDQALRFTQDEQSDESLEQVDLSSLLQSLVDDRCDADGRPSIATFAGQDRLVRSVQPVAVKRLFGNLIDNAIKYAGCARVALDEEGVSVVDPGQGFTVAEQADALKPYVRLDPARSQNQPGTGLGLAIAHNVCQRHGWRLSFEQSPGGFSVRVSFDDRADKTARAD